MSIGMSFLEDPGHSALKLEKSAISKVQKKHYLHFQKWQKMEFGQNNFS